MPVLAYGPWEPDSAAVPLEKSCGCRSFLEAFVSREVIEGCVGDFFESDPPNSGGHRQ